MSDALLSMTSGIVSAYISHHNVAVADIAGLVKTVHSALCEIENPVEVIAVPAVPIAKSITPDFLICLEDGKKLKLLKRHLRSTYGMTPEQYRERWGLPSTYPMVSANYAKARSRLAKEFKLGHKA